MPDNPEEFNEARYFQTAVLLMLHRQYEVLVRIARNTGTPPDALKEMVTKHRENDYDIPFEW